MVFVGENLFGVLAVEERSAAFRTLAVHLSAILQAAGVECEPYRSPSLEFFSALDGAAQLNALKELASYIDLCNHVVRQGGELSSSSTFTWRAISEAGLIPPSDLFSKIETTDIVEIYDLNNIQRFRNFRFFKYCSYTIEDLYCRPWHELFERVDDSITEKMIDVLRGLLETGNKQVVVMGVGPQIVREVDSRRLRVNELTVKHIAVLYDRLDKPSAFVVVESARQLPSA